MTANDMYDSLMMAKSFISLMINTVDTVCSVIPLKVSLVQKLCKYTEQNTEKMFIYQRRVKHNLIYTLN